jgi:hypothetical protein
MPHDPPVLAALHPEGARALRALVDFVSHHLPVPDHALKPAPRSRSE